MKNKEKLYSVALALTVMALFLILISSTVSAAAQSASPVGTYAYVTNFGSATVSVIDTATNNVTATVPVGDGPFGVAVTPDGSKVYVGNWYSGTVSVIDTSTNNVIATINVESSPWDVEVSPDGTKVYVTEGKTVSVIDTTTNNVTAVITLLTIYGTADSQGIAVSPDGTKVYVTDSSLDERSTVSVIDTATNAVTATVYLDLLGWGYSDIAIAPDGTKAYVTVGDNDQVHIIDIATNDIVTKVNVGRSPSGVAVSADGTKVYVTNLEGTVSVINTATNTVAATVNVGSGPQRIAVTPDGTKVYVTNTGVQAYNGTTVSVIDTETNAIIATVNVGSGARGVAVGPALGPITDKYLAQVEGSLDVYLIENEEKHLFTSPEALLWNGYSFDDVKTVTSETLQNYRDGEDISVSQPIIDKYHELGGEPIFGTSSGEGEKIGDQDSAGIYCSYVNFENGAIECFQEGDRKGEAYAIFNPLLTKWASMGYGKSVLGYPIDNMSNEETSKFGTKFRYQNFANGTEKGALEYNITSGNVFEIHGAIFAKWGAIGYANSVLGLVTSDERDAVPSFKGTTGRVNDFENGHLHWHGSGDHYMNTYMTYGDLDKFYINMGGTASDLGFPITDQQDGEKDSAGTYCSYVNFENGSIEHFENGDLAGKVCAVFNPFFNKWASMGYSKSVLGYPIDNRSDVQTSKFGTKFRYQNFANGTEKGALEYNITSGNVFVVHGTIFEKWGDLGYAQSDLGLPITDQQDGEKDSAGTYCSYVNFENGSIECFQNGNLKGRAYAIFNPFYTKWASMGYAKSVLGYPIDNMSDVQTSKFGTPFKYQNFANGTEKGALEYNLTSGNVFEIHGAIFAKWEEKGFAEGIVGLVTSDEKVANISPQGTIGKYSEFENGCIHWISNKADENIGHLQRGKSFVTYGDLNEMYDEMGGTGSELGFPIKDQITNADEHDYCEFEGGRIEWNDVTGVYEAYYNSAVSISCEIVAPVDQESFKKDEAIDFRGKAEGGNPPYAYAWIIDGNGFSTMYSEYTPPALSLGEHTVQLQVFDSLGNKAESATVHFTVYTKKVAVVPAKFSDSGTISDSSFETIENRCNLIQQYYRSQSYGAEYIDFDIYKSNSEDGWLRLSNSSSDKSIYNVPDYNNRISMWKEACDKAGIYAYKYTDENNHDYYRTKDFDTVLVLFPVEFRPESYRNNTYALCSTKGGYGNWTHELGHSLYSFNDKEMTGTIEAILEKERTDEGSIGRWGLMGTGCYFNPPAPIIGFEKIAAGWLSYKNISESDIGDSGNEYTMSYLDDSALYGEGLLRLVITDPTLMITTDSYIFEARRIKDGVKAESSTGTNEFSLGSPYPLDYGADGKGVVIYNVGSFDKRIWREVPLYAPRNRVTICPGESKYLGFGKIKATCLSDGDEMRVKIKHTILSKISTYTMTSTVRLLSNTLSPVPDESNLDVDLHVVTSDGKRVGIDYTNDTYNNEIGGALTSGNLLGGGPEWISVPEDTSVTAYATLSPDLKALLLSDGSASVEVNTSLIVFDENGNATQSEPISIRINSTNLKDQYQIPLVNGNSPTSVTNLQSTNGTTWLNWTWINPKDSDFNHTEIYLNGIFQTNTSAEFFNATGLESETDYTISTRTMDNNGNMNETWINSTATTLKAPIVVEAGSDQTVEEGADVNFEGIFTASGSHTYTYHWDFGDGSVEDSSLTTSHTYVDNGVYTANLTVTEEHEDSGNDTLLVTVNNALPVVNAGSDLEVTAGDPVSFKGDFSDSGWLDTHTAEWNFGEGTVEAGSVSEENEYPDSTGTVSGSFSYFDAGEYTVTLNVADDDGGIGQDQLTVTVRPIEAEVTFDPEVLYLNSTGDWVTAYIELPAGYNVSDIDIGSVLLNGTVPAVSDTKYSFVTNESEYLTDLDLDGIPERMFKFNRGEVAYILETGDRVTVTFTGEVGMASFEGSDVIKVTKKDSKKW